jgi:hypothetical protein
VGYYQCRNACRDLCSSAECWSSPSLYKLQPAPVHPPIHWSTTVQQVPASRMLLVSYPFRNKSREISHVSVGIFHHGRYRESVIANIKDGIDRCCNVDVWCHLREHKQQRTMTPLRDTRGKYVTLLARDNCLKYCIG